MFISSTREQAKVSKPAKFTVPAFTNKGLAISEPTYYQITHNGCNVDTHAKTGVLKTLHTNERLLNFQHVESLTICFSFHSIKQCMFTSIMKQIFTFTCMTVKLILSIGNKLCNLGGIRGYRALCIAQYKLIGVRVTYYPF